MLNFRAVLEGVSGLERAIQSFACCREMLKEWAIEIVRAHPEGRVVIYETREVEVGSIALEDVEKADASKEEKEKKKSGKR